MSRRGHTSRNHHNLIHMERTKYYLDRCSCEQKELPQSWYLRSCGSPLLHVNLQPSPHFVTPLQNLQSKWLNRPLTIWLKCKSCWPLDGNLYVFAFRASVEKCSLSSWVSASSGELRFTNVLFLNDTFSLLLTLSTLRRCTTLKINPHPITQSHHQHVYLQGQQGVAVAVCAKHVLF